MKATKMSFISSKKIFLLGGVLILLGVWGWGAYVSARAELQSTRQSQATNHFNQKIVSFMSLFIDAVLNARGEVDFDTRLKLANAVRDIGDPEILTQWQNFVASKDEQAAQQEVKKLLSLLVRKISN